jgi:hypothetical protein
MTTDGPAGFVLIAFAAVLVFCGLIGVMVWAYSSQSAKRRKSPVGGSTQSAKGSGQGKAPGDGRNGRGSRKRGRGAAGQVGAR